MDINNFIENIYRELSDIISPEYIELYENIKNERLKTILSTLHAALISSFKTMNERLPTTSYEAHFWADPSRALMKEIEITERLQRGLKKSPYSIEIDSYYQELIKKCNSFLNRSGGSSIPQNMDKVELYYTLPIFKSMDAIEKTSNPIISSNLKIIGEGSYAHVYKYKDEFYGKNFVLKRAKSNLDDKEIVRFKKEFEEMSKLASPYIVEVYNYNEDKNEYVMEHMDYSLYDYINKYNANINKNQRKYIGNQVLRAFNYIHSKGLLHRDISPRNILIREYEDTVVVKIADFGLVKVPESDLTSLQTDVKGSFNDPALFIDGFSKYDLGHEIYALTRLLCYIMTGKVNMDKIEDKKLKSFMSDGMNPDKDKRYKSLNELRDSFVDM